MKYWMTQSLLNSWLYYLNADEPYAEAALDSFLHTLQRKQTQPTKAMQDGIAFESMINDTVAGKAIIPPNEKWGMAIQRFSRICAGGRSQLPLTGALHIAGMDFVLYGICDYVKAGQIFDIKKVTRYEYGKYYGSPQHPMYLHLLPEAKKFMYLIFDGTNCYKETYRRGDCRTIEEIITEFVRYLTETDRMEMYQTYWTMNTEREEKINGIYKRGKQ